MNRTQFFTDSLAGLLRARLSAAGIRGVDAVGSISNPQAEGPRVEVQVTSSDEMIPGNHTHRLDCQMACAGLSAAEDEGRVEVLLERVSAVAMELLLEPWVNRDLPAPPGCQDAEYEAQPFVVLQLIAGLQPMETQDAGYEAVLPFRAYVQF